MIGNNWCNKMYFNRKNIRRTRVRISMKNKILNEKSPSYLFKLIPNFNRVHNTRLSYNIPPMKVRHDYFKNSFIPSARVEQA